MLKPKEQFDKVLEEMDEKFSLDYAYYTGREDEDIENETVITQSSGYKYKHFINHVWDNEDGTFDIIKRNTYPRTEEIWISYGRNIKTQNKIHKRRLKRRTRYETFEPNIQRVATLFL
jgi:hypothetical protein